MSTSAWNHHDLDRRVFIRASAQAVTGLLSSLRTGAASQPVGAELLDLAAVQLDSLRRQDGQHGGAQVLTAVISLTDHLARMLQGTRDGSPLRQRAARLTAEAADLAAWVAVDQGVPDLAARWNANGETAARLAQDADLVALSIGDRAWTALKAGHLQRSLELFDRLPADDARITPSARVYLEFQRAVTLGRARRERPAHHAIDRAMKLAACASAGEAPPWVSVIYGEQALEEFRGHCYVAMGLGEDAYELLQPRLRHYPTGMVRSRGILHLAVGEAVLQAGDVDEACDHLGHAVDLFDTTGSVFRRDLVLQLRRDALETYADTDAVHELDEQLHDGRAAVEAAQYVRVRSYNTAHEAGRPVLLAHRADCPMAKRSTHAQPWPEMNGHTPEELAADPAVRTCRHCFGRHRV